MKKRKIISCLLQGIGGLRNPIKLLFCIALICDNLFGEVSCITCFSCTVKPPSKQRLSKNGTTVRLCSKFDASPRYQVQCPLSTLCQTRTFQLHTRSGSHSVTTRGCAQQDYSYQTYHANESEWHTVTAIEESIYQEGCLQVADGAELRRHETQYCFCSTHLCNEAVKAGKLTSTLISIPVILLLKRFVQEHL